MSRGFLAARGALATGTLAVLIALGCATQQAAAPVGASTSLAKETPQRGGILDVAFAVAEPAHLDPLKGSSYSNTNLTGKAYNGLVQYDPLENTTIVPELAERWEISQDGKTYTFYLHKGVKWHDGTPFSAADVKYTLDRFLDPKDPMAPELRGKRLMLDSVDRVEATDATTVRLVLKRPSNSLLRALAYGSLVMAPKHGYEQGKEMEKVVIGTGPFKLGDYQRGSVFRLVRNPDYFVKDRPYLDGINIYLLKDNATRTAALATGQIKMLGFIYKPEIDQIKQSFPQVVVSSNDGLRNGFLGFQTEKAPFNDRRVRRAIHLALDREVALNVLVPGEGILGTFMAPSSASLSQEELAKLPGYRKEKAQDLAEAKRLLAEAGYPNGFKTAIATLANSEDYTALSVYGKDQLAKLGIEASITHYTNAESTLVRSGGNFEILSVVGVFFFPDASGGSSYYGPGNDYRWNDSLFVHLFQRQDAVHSPEERKGLIRQMEERWIEDAPYVMLYWKQHSAAMHPEVRGFKMGVGIYNNQRFQDVWLAQ